MIYTMGAELLSREQLRVIPLPEREGKTIKWKGVNHGELADELVNYVETLGFKVAKETWYCNPNQSALYGSIDVDSSDTDYTLDIGQEACYSIGVRHDNSGRYAVSLALGARIAVCQNGLFTGDFVLKNRHYESLNIKEMIADGIEEWLSRTGEVQKFIELMQKTYISDKEACYMISNSCETLPGRGLNCINWSYLQKVLYNWYYPPHDEFSARTMWSLYNDFTEVGKELSPPRQLKLLKGLKPLMLQYIETGELR